MLQDAIVSMANSWFTPVECLRGRAESLVHLDMPDGPVDSGRTGAGTVADLEPMPDPEDDWW